MMGASFSARLILAILIAAPLHVMLGFSERSAIGIGLIVAFFPKLLTKAFIATLGLSGRLLQGSFHVAASLIETFFKGIGKLFSKNKNRHHG